MQANPMVASIRHKRGICSSRFSMLGPMQYPVQATLQCCKREMPCREQSLLQQANCTGQQSTTSLTHRTCLTSWQASTCRSRPCTSMAPRASTNRDSASRGSGAQSTRDARQPATAWHAYKLPEAPLPSSCSSTCTGKACDGNQPLCISY